MHYTWLTVIFSVFGNFFKLKRGNLISWGEPILQNGWIIWSPLLYFNFRSLKDPNSLSFIRFQCILHDSAVLFSGFWNFLKLKRGDLISWGEPILQNGWIIWFPSYISILEVWRTQILCHSLDFNLFYIIEQYFSQVFEVFFKLKRGNLISWGEPILQNGWIIWSPLFFFNFKHLRDPNSSSFIRFQCILHDSAVLLSIFENFVKLK